MTPLSIGNGAENDWTKGADFVVKDNVIYIVDIASMVEQGIDITQLSDMLAKGDSNAILTLLGNKLEKVTKCTFCLPASSNDPIKTTFKNDLYDLPVIPGSSLKGSIRSVLFKHLRSEDEKRNNEVFGELKDGGDFMRFVKVTDVSLSNTSVYNTKLFNLQGENDKWHGAWKHETKKSSPNYQPSGFNTLYECIVPGEEGVGSIMLSPDLFNMYETAANNGSIRNNKPTNHVQKKQNILSGGIKNLFKIINDHTREYLEKEREFFNEYHTDRVDEIIDGIDRLLSEIPADNSAALLKMSAGSGFHSITGDWKYDDYVDIGTYTKEESKQHEGKHRYKSRRIVTYDDSLHLMGFVKLYAINDDEYSEALIAYKENCQAIINARVDKRDAIIKAKQEEELRRKEIAEKYENLITEALKAEETSDFALAIQKAEEASVVCSTGNRHAEIIERCTLKQKLQKADDVQKKFADNEASAREEKVKAGLAALLDEKYLEGMPKAGTYKVNTAKICLSKVAQWMKVAKVTELTPEQKTALLNTLKRLKDNPDKKEVKEWNNPKSKLWLGIAEYLTREDIQSI